MVRIIFCLVLVSFAMAWSPMELLRRFDDVGDNSRTTDSTFNQYLAEIALSAAFSTYCDKGIDNGFDCPYCQRLNMLEGGDYRYVNYFGDFATGTYGYVSYSTVAQRIIIAFRGTYNVDGWLGNMKAAQSDLPGDVFSGNPDRPQVHSGFLEGVVKEFTTMFGLYLRAQRDCGGQCRVLFCGHSLGGAQSLLALSQWYLELSKDRKTPIPPADYVSFGSPRVGDVNFVKWYRANVMQPNGPVQASLRFVHDRDPVPHVPPRGSIMKYMHVPQEIFQIDIQPTEQNNNQSSYRIVVCSPDDEDPTCSDTVSVYEVADHSFYLGFPTRCSMESAMIKPVSMSKVLAHIRPTTMCPPTMDMSGYTAVGAVGLDQQSKQPVFDIFDDFKANSEVLMDRVLKTVQGQPGTACCARLDVRLTRMRNRDTFAMMCASVQVAAQNTPAPISAPQPQDVQQPQQPQQPQQQQQAPVQDDRRQQPSAPLRQERNRAPAPRQQQPAPRQPTPQRRPN